MKVSIMVAMDRNGIIGSNDRLPWHLSADLKHFKTITMGKPIVMGRKTCESIGRPLPGRENIVVTQDRNYQTEACTVLHSLEEVYAHCQDADEIMIMGGAELYRQTIDRADRIYLTEVHASCDGDTGFPEFDRNLWCEIRREDFRADEKNEFDFSFVILDRKTISLT